MIKFEFCQVAEMFCNDGDNELCGQCTNRSAILDAGDELTPPTYVCEDCDFQYDGENITATYYSESTGIDY